jgi:hypothetical protein
MDGLAPPPSSLPFGPTTIHHRPLSVTGYPPPLEIHIEALQLPPSGLPTLQSPLNPSGPRIWTYHPRNTLSLSCFFTLILQCSGPLHILLNPPNPFSRGRVTALSFRVSAIATDTEFSFQDPVPLIPYDPLTNANISSPRAQHAEPIYYIYTPAETLIWQPLFCPPKAASFAASLRFKLAPDVLTRPSKKMYSLRIELWGRIATGTIEPSDIDTKQPFLLAHCASAPFRVRGGSQAWHPEDGEEHVDTPSISQGR